MMECFIIDMAMLCSDYMTATELCIVFMCNIFDLYPYCGFAILRHCASSNVTLLLFM